MEITKRPGDSGCTISLHGELDASTSLQVYQALEEAWNEGKKFVKVNCQGLKYISSAGLGVFLAQMPQPHTPNHTLVLYQVSRKIKNVFSILGLDKIIPIVRNEAEANAYIQNQNGVNFRHLMQG